MTASYPKPTRTADAASEADSSIIIRLAFINGDFINLTGDIPQPKPTLALCQVHWFLEIRGRTLDIGAGPTVSV